MMNHHLLILIYISLNLVTLNICDYGMGASYNATITGSYSDHITDYGYLTVDVGVNVYSPDEYSLSGSLYNTNNKEVGWSIDHENLSIGSHIMHLNFDIKTIELGSNESLHLSNLKLTSGSSDSGLALCDFLPRLYYLIASDFTNYVPQISTEKQLTGVGYGELLLKFAIQDTAPVISGRYSYDLTDIHIPPIEGFNVTSTNKSGYSYSLPGVYIPGKPNNFTVTATRVENLNIGLRKDPVKTGVNNNGAWITTQILARTWITTQILADKNGIATATSDLLSPGSYQVKIFGDAVENVSQVNLTMTLVKKIIVNGPFRIGFNTTGFPSGSYSITAKALNGSFNLNELAIGF